MAPRISLPYVEGTSPTTYGNPAGNPVLHGTNTFAIFWDPTDHYHGDWQAQVESYLQHAGSASGSLAGVFAVDAQYTDRSDRPASYAQTFKGSYSDYHAYPASGCTDPTPSNSSIRSAANSEGPPRRSA